MARKRKRSAKAAPAGSTPVRAREGKSFDASQGKPFDASQGKPFDASQGKPFDASQGKPVSASRAEYVEVVLPGQANPLGNVLGGHVMHLIDITAAIAAHRHSNSYAATVAVDYLDFRHPIKVGQLIVLKASVNRVFQTSMEVGVKVFSEDILTGERRHTSSAYVTFVALDEQSQPQGVPPVISETEEDRRRWRDAEVRRRIRLELRYKKAGVRR